MGKEERRLERRNYEFFRLIRKNNKHETNRKWSLGL